MVDFLINDRKAMITDLGGIAIPLENRTGSPSVKGTMVDTALGQDFAFTVEGLSANDAFGVVYDDGVADGEICYVVISGVAQVLLEDSTGSIRGNWCQASESQVGRVDATNLAPPGGTITAIDKHFREVGHCLETKTAGTNVLMTLTLHFN